MKIIKKPKKTNAEEFKESVQRWLESYTWIQPDGSIDFSMPRCRPAGLPVDQREMERT